MGLGTAALLDLLLRRRYKAQTPASSEAGQFMCAAAPACSRCSQFSSGKNWVLRARTDTKQVPRCPETKMRDDALGEEGSLNAPTAHFIMHACTIM